MKIIMSILAIVFVGNFSFANDAAPCFINIPDVDSAGIESQQLPAILRSELLSYYDSCDEKPTVSLHVLLTESEEQIFPFKNEMIHFLKEWGNDTFLSSQQESTNQLVDLNNWKSNSNLIFGAFNYNEYLSKNGCTAENIKDVKKYNNLCNSAVEKVKVSMDYFGAIAKVMNLFIRP